MTDAARYGDAFQRVRQGDPASSVLRAATFNSLLEMRKEWQAQRIAQPGGSIDYASPWLIRVQNKTGAGLDRFSVVELGNAVILPTASLYGFQEQILVEANSPGTPADGKNYGILQEPIPANGIGMAAASGVTHAIVNVTNAAHKYAAASNGVLAKLVSAVSGPIAILYRETGTGDKWAVVAFTGNPATGLPGGTGSIGVREADLSPSLTGITDLVFDQADGFTVTDAGGGVANLGIADATASQAGVVSTATQTFGGIKTFLGNVVIEQNLTLYTGIQNSPVTNDFRLITSTVNNGLYLNICRWSGTGWTNLYGFVLSTSGVNIYSASGAYGVGGTYGISGTATLAKLTAGGANGSLTITGGIITAKTDPT